MKKILIIEDDVFLKNIEAAKFTREGFLVAAAMTQAEVDAGMDPLPDVILLDLMIPGLNCFELLEKFKKDDKTKSIPVLIFSNLSGEGEMKHAMDAGAHEFIIKSNFTLDEVVDKIKLLTA